MITAGPFAGRRLHFVGIGGAGMSGLALLAAQLGAEVSGSDRAESPYMAELRAAGIEPAIGHDAAHVPDAGEIVRSTAVPPDNPELAAARDRGLGELHRSELMAQLAALKRCIAVSGTHGKTTTSAMIVCALRGAGMDPAYLVGGELRETGANAGWGTGEWIVVEADESDRSLLALAPEIAVLTNAELDHHTTYGSRLDLEATLREFLTGPAHAVIWDRPELLALRDGDAVAFEVADPVSDAAGSRFEFDGVAVEPKIIAVDWDVSQAQKGGFDHFMLKEIHEQPGAIRDTLVGRVVDGRLTLDELRIRGARSRQLEVGPQG